MNLDAATSYAIKQLEPIEKTVYYYHNVYHALDVFKSVAEYGLSEKINGTDLMLLKTAAIFHDIGIINSYNAHEEESVRIIHEVLPGFDYSVQQIDAVGKLIMATKMPTNPGNDLEKLICDADLDYLGREDYIEISDRLKREMEVINRKKFSAAEWLDFQLGFLVAHNYYSQTARSLRNDGKLLNIIKIQKLLKKV
ncbi:MAG TPA: HD domain-containing protein [Bacteroidales bacterium]|nr:HD domain-containing protein [Bacteroidales bacterium]